MFKIISAEIKKILTKPGVFILSVLLAVLLVLGVFIYKPTLAEDNYVTLTGTTITAKYAQYYANGAAGETGIKVQVENEIDNTLTQFASYSATATSTDDGITLLINGSSKSYEALIAEKLEIAYVKLDDYSQYAYFSGADSRVKEARNNAKLALVNLNNIITKAINLNVNKAYPVITTKANYASYTSHYDNSVILLNIGNDPKIEETSNEVLNHLNSIKACISNFFYPTLSNNLINDYVSSNETSKYHQVTNVRLVNIENEIEAMLKTAKENEDYNKDSKNVQAFENLVNKYIATANTYTNLVNYELLANAFNKTSTDAQLDLLYLNTYSAYNVNSSLIRYSYLFDNNKTTNDFANPLSISVTSSNEINAYDYAYFVIRLFSFILIVYAVMCASYTIAGEIKEGSMRYLAIRPVTRNKMIVGKLLAILIISIILILFSTLIAVLVGGFIYGFNSLNILTVFNGSLPVVLHPLAMLAIYLLSMLLELVIYASIALLLSCLLKSDLAALTLVLLLYLLNTLLPVFAGGMNSWLAYYPFSHISLFALFGSSVYAQPNNILSLLLGSKVYAGTNAILTIVLIVVFIAITNLISAYIFKKKEL